MYIATVDTTFYSWTALGATEAEALAALRAGYGRHTQHMHGEADTRLMEELIDGGDVNVYQIDAGMCLRDGSVI